MSKLKCNNNVLHANEIPFGIQIRRCLKCVNFEAATRLGTFKHKFDYFRVME